MLDQLETGPWPSFVTGLKRLAADKEMMVDMLGQLEHSYTTKMGYWKGGTASVIGYVGGVIPRFSEIAHKFLASAEFHTLRIMPAPAMPMFHKLVAAGIPNNPRAGRRPRRW